MNAWHCKALAGFLLALASAVPAARAQYIPGAACPAHQWANGYGFTTGLACAQPGFGDLAGTANAGQVSGAFAGFVNKLRGNSLSQWYSGTTISVTTSGGWAAEGVYVVPSGASVTASQVTSPQAGGPYYALKILGATSNTDVRLRFPIESFDAAPLAGKTVTFQITYQNKSGASITPTLTTKYAGSQDLWSSPTTDLSAAVMQSCASNAICTAAYTLSVNSAANNGYTPTVDFGALGSGAYVDIISFDMRVTPGVTTGLNAFPPTPEIINAALDATWCNRFYQVLAAGRRLVGFASASSSATGVWNFTSAMRAGPTIGFPDVTNGDYAVVIASGFASSTSAPTATTATAYGTSVQFNTGAVLPAGQGLFLQLDGTATITADARIAGA